VKSTAEQARELGLKPGDEVEVGYTEDPPTHKWATIRITAIGETGLLALNCDGAEGMYSRCDIRRPVRPVTLEAMADALQAYMGCVNEYGRQSEIAIRQCANLASLLARYREQKGGAS
jgi:hypothetical protein